jgi:hypothetical protein
MNLRDQRATLSAFRATKQPRVAQTTCNSNNPAAGAALPVAAPAALQVTSNRPPPRSAAIQTPGNHVTSGCVATPAFASLLQQEPAHLLTALEG